MSFSNQSSLPSPYYETPRPYHAAMHGFHGIPFNPMAPLSSANATAFTNNTMHTPLKGMLSVGNTAPHFTARAVIDGRIKDIDLAQFIQNHEWLILVFIPMAWSYVCPTEIRVFDRRIQEFEKRTCAVVFCSTDSEYVLQAWNNTPEEQGGLGGVHVPLISDRSHRIAKEYGVLIEDEGVTHRAMFIIDPRGVIRQVTINDVNVGRSVDEARRLLEALEFLDEFGEGCPIDWKKGDRGVSAYYSNTPNKRGSTATANLSSPQSSRPKQVRTHTWQGNLGWLTRKQGSSSSGTATQSQASSQTLRHKSSGTRDSGKSQRADSMPNASNWGAASQNGQQSLTTVETPSLPQPQSPSSMMTSMGGYFEPVVSPLEQPQTVLNAMMHTAH